MEEKPRVVTIGGHRRPTIRRPQSRLTRSGPVSPVYTKSVRRRPLSQNSQNTRPTTQLSQTRSTMNDPKCENMRNEVFETKDFIKYDLEELQQLNVHLKEYTSKCALEENYQEAKKSHEIQEMLQVEIRNRRISAVMSSRTMQLQAAQTEQEINQSFDEQIKTIDEEMEKKREEILESNNKELEEFERLWREDMPRRYEKPSQALLNLKEIERQLALQKEFDRASSVHEEAVALASKEHEAAQRALVRDYKKMKRALIERQKRDTEHVDAIRERRVASVELQRAARLKEAKNRVKVLTQKQRESMTAARERSDPAAVQPTAYAPAVKKRSSDTRSLLGPLIAPNDPEFVREERRKEREKRQRQLELQRKNADEVLGPSDDDENDDQKDDIDDDKVYKAVTSPAPKVYPVEDEEALGVDMEQLNREEEEKSARPSFTAAIAERTEELVGDIVGEE